MTIMTRITEENVPPWPQQDDAHLMMAIAGGGIVGLTLALAIKKEVGLIVPIYEQAPGFADEVGAGMGMYPNGLRVLQEIGLLEAVRAEGYPYQDRRYERHDGTLVIASKEDVLSTHHHHHQHHQQQQQQTPSPASSTGSVNSAPQPSHNHYDMTTMGIRRWRLQKVLYQAVLKEGIPIYFNKKIVHVEQATETECIEVTFEDQTKLQTQLLLGVDGSKSRVREAVFAATQTYTSEVVPQDDHGKNSRGGNQAHHQHPPATSKSPKLEYTGTTCLMGISTGCPRQSISFPSSLTSHCHAVFFPTGPREQCFQFHFDVANANQSSWRPLDAEEAREECLRLATQLTQEGWHEDYIQPLRHATHVVRVGFCLLQPRLQQWVLTKDHPHQKGGHVCLVGDAAHPPVPYTGQGCQQGLEDAGTLAMLLRHFCCVQNDVDGSAGRTFRLDNLPQALRLYEQIRIPRTHHVLDCSTRWGRIQEQRSEKPLYNEAREELIKRDVFFHDALSLLFPGVDYDYKVEVTRILEQHVVRMPIVVEERCGE